MVIEASRARQLCRRSAPGSGSGMGLHGQVELAQTRIKRSLGFPMIVIPQFRRNENALSANAIHSDGGTHTLFAPNSEAVSICRYPASSAGSTAALHVYPHESATRPSRGEGLSDHR